MAAEEPARFHAERPSDLRDPPPWNHLAYISRTLPRTIEKTIPHLAVSADARIFDFGCADLPYRHLFPPSAHYLAADLPGNPAARLTIRADGSTPVEDATCDTVLSTQVLEHVDDPEVYLRECFRILKPGGRLLLSTHGMMQYHPDPGDYWRWTGAGLQKAVRDRGFEVIHFEGVMGMTSCGLQLFQDGLAPRLPLLLRRLLALAVQSAIGFVERFEDPEGRRLNALVYVLVAVKR